MGADASTCSNIPNEAAQILMPSHDKQEPVKEEQTPTFLKKRPYRKRSVKPEAQEPAKKRRRTSANTLKITGEPEKK